MEPGCYEMAVVDMVHGGQKVARVYFTSEKSDTPPASYRYFKTDAKPFLNTKMRATTVLLRPNPSAVAGTVRKAT